MDIPSHKIEIVKAKIQFSTLEKEVYNSEE